MFADDDPVRLGRLAGNKSLIAAEPSLVDRLAATGYADVMKGALGSMVDVMSDKPSLWSRAWSPRARRNILAAPRGAGWTGPEGALADLFEFTCTMPQAAVVCPLPGAARTCLEKAGGTLTRAEQLRALLTIHDHDGGRAALEQLADAGALRPDVVEVVREALTDAGALRKAVELAEGTGGLIEELHDDRPEQRREECLALREQIDWTAVAAAAASRPFDEKATALLIARPDFPNELRTAWYQERGVLVATHSARVDPGMFTLDPGGPRAAKATAVLVRRGLDEGLSAAQVLESARPAAAVLEAVRQPPEASGGAWRDLAALLADLVRERLGDDVEAWRSARALLSRFGGTVPELLDKSATTSAKSEGGWPGGAGMPAPERSSSVTGARAAFLTLLDAAPTATHAALLPHLDDRTVCDLFGHGRWRTEWIDLALTARQPGCVRVLANCASLTAGAVEALMRLDDPAVNARLFRRSGATAPQRERLLSGRPMREGATEPLPLDPALIQELMRRTSGWRGRDPVDCADVELQRHILEHVRVRGIVPQLRMVLNLWERHGADAVAALLENPPRAVSHTRMVIRREVRKTVTRLLAGKDRDAALAELRAEVAEGETVRWQSAALREQHFSGAELFREAHHWRWAELLAEHARHPLPPLVLKGLSNIPECSREFRDESEAIGDDSAPDELQLLLDEGRTSLEILGASNITPYWGSWLLQAVRWEGLTWDDVLEHARPAHVVLKGWGDHMRTQLAPLVREHLDPSPQAWVLALRMLPEFTGSVAELVRTAAAATGVETE
ncbi:hypothetical protein HTZ77_09185 [Nonomuraea sp. SMC257]|uniref:Uncharacterized protein n=1 Tax=Nonomuraea montanisoli TaxID=2741721 RepID=A0A7Y6I5M2_9ACTN|nr:hypothetical protein [Nonomuraea montanisoli]NUW31598.1 hypothetical protein [Nonomuraea montanisoli]